VDFSVDQALVWAISRQESGFNPRAKSRARAAGLMQIMPSTASYVTKNRGYRGRDRHLLLNPLLNLEIGQAYIRTLLREPVIDGSVVRLLAAYNGGPGNLRKWLRKIDHQDDPFLLIESIPARETRHYIKSVITNLSLYRMQLGEPAPELLGLAEGGSGQLISMLGLPVVESGDGS
jgi:soluble lytic murein transglycosylase-like protein